MSRLRSDLASVRRRLLGHPADWLITATTLAAVIGVGTAVFAVVYGTMLRPLPFPDEARIVRVFTLPPGVTESRSRNPLASVDFVRFAERTRTLDGLEAIWQRERSLIGVGEPVMVKAGGVSAGFFQLLGGRAVVGRTFTPAEDEAGSPLVVISYGLWQRVFAGDPSVLGRTLSIDGEPHVVIGVMNAAFEPAYRESELWTPLSVNAHNMPLPNATYLVAIGRLAPGRTLPEARREFAQLMDGLGREVSSRRDWTVGVETLRAYQFGDRRGTLLVIATMTALLLLLAAGNVSNVTLARTFARRDEFAVRVNIGARPADLLRLVCLETLVVYTIAAVAGLSIAAIGLPLLLSLDPNAARTLGPTTIDWRVATAAFVVAAVLGCISGVWPAAGAMRRPDSHPGNLRTTGSRKGRRLQSVLVGVQATLAMTVLVVGGSLLDAFWRTSRATPGLDASDVLTAQVRLSSRYATHEQRIAFMDTLLESVRRSPVVAAASCVSSPFVPGFTYSTGFEVENQPTPDGRLHGANFRRIAPGYFAALRIPLLKGRDIRDPDRRTTPWVAVISQSLAERVWPGQDPIGHRIRRKELGTDWMTVVGIVGDVRDVSLTEGPDPTLYVSQEQHLPTTLPIALVVRTRGDTSVAVRDIRAALASLDAGQVVDRFLPMTDYLDASLASDRFRAVLVALFGVTGLLLLLVGLGGLTARAIAQRTREIGVRLALGAAPTRLWVTTTGGALKSVLAGTAAGGAAALVAFRVMRAALVGVQPPSIAMWGMYVVLVVVSCAAAAAIPAHRVVGVNPIAALKTD